MVAIAITLVLITVMAADPFAGTWKLRVGSPGTLQVKSFVLRIDSHERGQVCTYDLVDADGQNYHAEMTPKFDGNDYRVTGAPVADTVSLSRINSKTLDYFWKKGGHEVERWRSVVSRDGKLLTVTLRKRDARGAYHTIISVWDKQ